MIGETRLQIVKDLRAVATALDEGGVAGVADPKGLATGLKRYLDAAPGCRTLDAALGIGAAQAQRRWQTVAEQRHRNDEIRRVYREYFGDLRGGLALMLSFSKEALRGAAAVAPAHEDRRESAMLTALCDLGELPKSQRQLRRIINELSRT